MSKEDGGEVEMDGEDVRKREVYKKRWEYWKGDWKRRKERNRRKGSRRRKWIEPPLYKPSLLGNTYKVEFYQPSCWFYSVPSLLVF